MNYFYLFEFQDQDWLPSSLRNTLLEILECCNTNFLPYTQWVSQEILGYAQTRGLQNIVELGAGTAPITKQLAQDHRSHNLQLIPCDLKPAIAIYTALEKQYPGKISGITIPVDFAEPQQWQPSTLLVLSTTFHHIPWQDRYRTLASLTQSADGVMVFEPMRKTPASIFATLWCWIPALLLPIVLLGRSGQWRRLFWCWVLPVAPMLFLWDGLVSWLRVWNNREWYLALGKVANASRLPTFKRWLVAQLVAW
jgi:hypothetical protein